MVLQGPPERPSTFVLPLMVSEDALFSAPSVTLLLLFFSIVFHICPQGSEEWHPPLHLAPDKVDGITNSMNMKLANSGRY